MFGYVTANCTALSQEQLDRYRGCYCGLCRAIGSRYGARARLFVSYDLAFLVLFRSALEEPEETASSARCPTHLLVEQKSWSTRWTDFGADLSVLLAWHSADDAARDGRRILGGAGRAMLNAAYEKAKANRPAESALIARKMKELHAVQDSPEAEADAAAEVFGQMLGGIFSVDGGRWEGVLYDMGDYLGRFIYMADAVCDIRSDLRTGNYNPLKKAYLDGERDFSAVLSMLMAECTKRFEILPIVQDVAILRNVLYSGVWQKLAEAKIPKGKGKTDE